MKHQVLILGAGFGGLELAARLSAALREEVDVVLVDRSDTFAFGFSKLDVLFGRQRRDQVLLPYRDIDLPGVEFRQERVTRIDPVTRHVATDTSSYEPEILVLALGADYDLAATPGFAEGGFEYYTMDGAERLRDHLETFTGGQVVLAVLSIPFKCPPAPYEGALLLHDHLVRRGLREASTLQVISPQPAPIPVSPAASAAVEGALADRGIRYTKRHRVYGIDPDRGVALMKDSELPYDLFIGIPVHKAPDVLVEAGLTEEGWVKVEPRTLRTAHPGIYALGDCAETGIPKAGVFAESAARAVADDIVATLRGGAAGQFDGSGLCFIEFGGGAVGRVDVDFFAEGGPMAPLLGPAEEYVEEKERFGADRRARWFGR